MKLTSLLLIEVVLLVVLQNLSIVLIGMFTLFEAFRLLTNVEKNRQNAERKKGYFVEEKSIYFLERLPTRVPHECDMTMAY